MLMSYIMLIMHFIRETLRRGGSNWSYYWNRLLGKILFYPMPDKYPPDTIIYSTSRDHARNILLLLGLMAASSKNASVLNIYLSGENMLKMKLKNPEERMAN